jgi:pyruvate,orthophosphate dikinase
MPGLHRELLVLHKILEAHYKEVQDFEFTIEKGVLYLLQTRNGKRTGKVHCVECGAKFDDPYHGLK